MQACGGGRSPSDYLMMLEHQLEKIYVHGNILHFDGGIDENTILKAVKLLQENESVDTIHLTTFGGDVGQGFKFITFIRGLSRKINIHIAGYAMSMGTYILAAATGRKSMGKFSMLMYHQMSNFPGWSQNTSSTKTFLENLEFYEQIAKSIVNPKNNKDIEEFLEEVNSTDKDFYLNSADALELKLVDKIIH